MERKLHVDNKEPGQSLHWAVMRDASRLSRASLLTPLNYPGGPAPHLFLNTSHTGSGWPYKAASGLPACL